MSSTAALGPAPSRYGLAPRLLHWLTAALILAMFVLGGWIVDAPPHDEALSHRLYNLHESSGMLIWLLVLLRIVLRLSGTAPPLPLATPRAVRLLASLNQALLYLVLLVQPLLGLADANAWGAPLRWFELFVVPSPIGKSPPPLPQELSDLHWWGAALLLALLLLHLAGAARHGLRRDGVLRHML